MFKHFAEGRWISLPLYPFPGERWYEQHSAPSREPLPPALLTLNKDARPSLRKAQQNSNTKQQ